MKKLNIKKEASRETIINDVVNQNDLRSFTLSKAYNNDPDIQKLFSEIYSHFAEKLKFNSNELGAWNRMLRSISQGDKWSPDMQRNNIFKAANLLGIKLPSSMF